MGTKPEIGHEVASLLECDDPDFLETPATLGDCMARLGNALGHIGDTESACRYIEEGRLTMHALRDSLRPVPSTLSDISDAEEALRWCKQGVAP